MKRRKLKEKISTDLGTILVWEDSNGETAEIVIKTEEEPSDDQR